MITIENENIKVTISEEMYQSFLPTKDRIQILPSGEIRVHNREAEARGRILSTAMEVLYNRKEAERLDQFDDLDLSEEDLVGLVLEARSVVREGYVRAYLEENSKYADGEVFGRWSNERRLSTGMEFELGVASAYADARIGDIDYENLFKETIEKYGDIRARQVFKATKEGKDLYDPRSIDETIVEILRIKQWLNKCEKAYRHRFDSYDMDIVVKNPEITGNTVSRVCHYATGEGEAVEFYNEAVRIINGFEDSFTQRHRSACRGRRLYVKRHGYDSHSMSYKVTIHVVTQSIDLNTRHFSEDVHADEFTASVQRVINSSPIPLE